MREQKNRREDLLEILDERSSEQERRVDAKALMAEEGRDKLRKAAGSRKWAVIRGYPNGGTRPGQCPVTHE